MSARVVFVGLGAMGAPMAERLAQSGYAVCGIDAQAAREAAWRARVGGAEHDVAEADAVLTCVTDETAAARVAAETILPRIARGALWVDHTTTSPAFARELAAAAAARGAGFVDAPVSGGAEGAASGTLVAMAGGEPADTARARPLLAAYAARVVHLGAAGSGQFAKLANQVAIAGTVRGLAEAVALARAGGIDAERLLEALAGGTAGSVQLARTAATLADPAFDFATAFAWLGKDLDLASAEAARRGVAVPLAALVKRTLEMP